MSRFSEIAKKVRLAKLVASKPVSEPEPELEQLEEVVPEIDETTRAARACVRELTMGRIGGPVYFDEMSATEIRHWRRRHQLAMMEPPPNPWLGKRRLIWDRAA
jgi:hypothetical protein